MNQTEQITLKDHKLSSLSLHTSLTESLKPAEHDSDQVIPFVTRQHELAIVVRRISSGGIISDVDAEKFSLELKNFHTASAISLLKHFNSNQDQGLSSQRAIEILLQSGSNLVSRPRELNIVLKFFLCFFYGFSPLLWIAAFFVFLSYEPFGTPPGNKYNLALAILLLIIIFLSGLFTFYQEVQTSLALASFKNLIPTQCIVIRDGTTILLEAADLVVGDIVKFQPGGKVPADIRVLQAANLEIDKSMLTGEAEPVKLVGEAVDGSRTYLQSPNIAFMGCNIVSGEGHGLVVATGKDAQVSKISDSLSGYGKKLSSLQRDINRFVFIISIFSLTFTVCVICVWAGYLDVQHKDFMTPSSMVANAIGVLVALVPQGLPLSLQMGLTIIATRLCKKHNVLVRQLSTIETLGSMSVLCSDKTGTLTQNVMTVTAFITVNGNISSLTSFSHDFQSVMYKIAILCNQSTYHLNEETMQREVVGGNGVDQALLKWATLMNAYDNTRQLYSIKCVLPFSSVTKLSATVVEDNLNRKRYVLVKGAPEYIIDLCESYMDTDGSIGDLKENLIAKIKQDIENCAEKGERVIAVAYLPLLEDKYQGDYVFNTQPHANFPIEQLVFIACVAVSDPPRPGMLQAVLSLRQAGVQVAMVTGDALTTAEAIARQVGIIARDDRAHRYVDGDSIQIDDVEAGSSLLDTFKKRPTAVVVDGKSLDSVTQEGWDFIFSFDQRVFARTTPEQKLQIVKECQLRGHLVGVTGDGVNDAPALKRADIGIAMFAGSDVAKDAAVMVLLQNDFAAIVKGVEEGRIIFENLRKVIAYMIAGGCFSELVPVLATFFLGVPTALSSLLCVVICVLGDTYAGIALTMEPSESHIMKLPPRDPKKRPLVDLKLVCYSYFFYGILTSIFSFYVYFTYMASRGNTRAVPNPVPLDDDGTRLFPAGYRSSQLVAAWNWGLNTGNLGADNIQASIEGSSVLFMALTVFNWGHLISVRRKTPYFSDAILNTTKSTDGVWKRLWDEILNSKPRLPILVAIALAACTVNVFVEDPLFQSSCGTASVPAEYWGLAIGFSALVFSIAELRKWIIIFFPTSLLVKLIAW